MFNRKKNKINCINHFFATLSLAKNSFAKQTLRNCSKLRITGQFHDTKYIKSEKNNEILHKAQNRSLKRFEKMVF